MYTETKGKLQISVENAQNIPFGVNSYVELRINDQTRKTSRQSNVINPSWNEMLVFEDISINESFTLQLKDYRRSTKSKVIGKSVDLHLMDIMNEAKGKLGYDFNHTKKLAITGANKGCSIIISINFEVGSKQDAKDEEPEEQQV